MKTTLIFLLFLFSLNINSQNPLLTNQNWYVQSLNINSTNINIPSDPLTFPYAYLYFSSLNNYTYSSNEIVDYYTNETICEIGFVSHLNYIQENQFNFSDFTPIFNQALCDTNLIGFMTEYFNFFNSTIQNNYIYSIIDGVNNSKTLTITNSNNDYITLTNKFITPPPFELTNIGFWYLNKLTINNVSYFPTVESVNIPSPPWINFHYDSQTQFLYSRVCLDLFLGIQNFDIDANQFYYYRPIQQMYGCANDFTYEATPFHDMNVYFYNQQAPGPFHYFTENNNQDQTLIITGPNGDNAIYKNSPMSNSEYLDVNLKIYPNPVFDFLKIENNNQIEIEKIKITNLLGQVLFETKKNLIDFSNFNQGIYNIYIETKQGILNKLIIKK